MLDVVLMGHAEMWAAMRERDAIYANPDAGEEEFLHAAELEAKYAEYGGYTAEARAGELLLGLGVPTEQHHGPMSAVAPGWKLRVLLAQALFGDPDILLLDEPTNNLDINSIRWLEDVLNRRTSTMVIISHDRHFLSSVCTHMADVDYGEIRVYPGNYDDYMEASTLAKQQLQKDNAKAKDRIADLRGLRAALPRPQGQGAPGDLAHEADREAQGGGREALQPPVPVHPLPGRPEGEAAPPRGRGEGPRSSTASCSEPRSIEAGEKVAIIGPNGAGKTTLLQNLLEGPVKWAEKARPGYWPQDPADEFETDETLAEWLSRWRRKDLKQDDQIVRATLGQLLFSGDDQKKSLKVISGGEGQRMMIGKLVLGMPNVMLLDEPTNHLDMESIESLNTALDKYTGTLVFVSHDREFVSSLATRVIELKSDKTFVDYRGGYEEYLAAQNAELAAASCDVVPAKAGTHLVAPASRGRRSARPVAVRPGDDLEQVAARVLEVNAAAAEVGVGLALLLLPGIGPVFQLALLDAAEDLVELRIAHQERVVLHLDFHAVGREEGERHLVSRLRRRGTGQRASALAGRRAGSGIPRRRAGPWSGRWCG